MILRGCINSSTNSFGYLKGSLAGVTGVVKKFPTNWRFTHKFRLFKLLLWNVYHFIWESVGTKLLDWCPFLSRLPQHCSPIRILEIRTKMSDYTSRRTNSFLCTFHTLIVQINTQSLEFSHQIHSRIKNCFRWIWRCCFYKLKTSCSYNLGIKLDYYYYCYY